MKATKKAREGKRERVTMTVEEFRECMAVVGAETVRTIITLIQTSDLSSDAIVERVLADLEKRRAAKEGGAR